jgi:tetratricopeptide (TPR) repeat protein
MPKPKTENQDLKQRYIKLIEILPDRTQSDPLSALKDILEAREWAIEQNDTESIARFYQFEGNCLHALSRPLEALKATYQALNLFEKLEIYPNIIACQIELGFTYINLGDFPDGIEWLELALGNSKVHNRPLGIYTSLSNIRDAEMRLGNFEQALKYGEQSLLLAKELNSNYRIANEQAELGITQIKLGQKNFDDVPKESIERFKTGLNLLRQAQETSKQNPTYGFEVNVLNAQTVALAELGQIEVAFEISDLAIKAASHNDDPATTADSEKTRGWLYFKMGQTAKSLIHYEKALEIYSAIGKKDEIANTHRELAKVCKESHQYAEALEHLEKFYELDAQLKTDAAERRAQALAAKLDLEKARHDAEMHRVRSEELAALNLQLQDQAVLLEKLAREDELTGLANRRRL